MGIEFRAFTLCVILFLLARGVASHSMFFFPIFLLAVMFSSLVSRHSTSFLHCSSGRARFLLLSVSSHSFYVFLLFPCWLSRFLLLPLSSRVTLSFLTRGARKSIDVGLSGTIIVQVCMQASNERSCLHGFFSPVLKQI